MNLKNVFVVFDPTRPDQPALSRVEAIVDEASVAVHVYACIFSKLDADESAKEQVQTLLRQQKETVEQAVAPLVDKGVTVTTEVEWDKDWYEAVVRASIRSNADLVLKSSYPHSARQRVLNRTSDWTLIRECLCPVLLVKDMEIPQKAKILAAVDIRAEDKAYERLNEQIIQFSQRMMEGPQAEVHFINAFESLKAAPSRHDLAKSCAVSTDRIHIQIGNRDDVIVDQAKNMGASLVVVGNSARSGVSAMVNGNTVERVLDKLECDVLSIP
jgi:universal stress protein E